MPAVALADYDPAWPARFETERAALMSALGFCTAGGVVYDIEHIGSTAVPGLAAKPCLDILIDAHPLPLQPDKLEALAALGYRYRGENGLPDGYYFVRGPHDVHLHVVSRDAGHWARRLVFRDYLRANADAKERYANLKRALASRFPDDRTAYSEDKGPLIAELEHEAFAWHIETTGFEPVQTLARELAGVGVLWFVTSGWALELFAGRPSRYHDDIDLGIFRQDAARLRAHLLARGWRLDKCVGDGEYSLWNTADLEPEVTQVHARRGDAFLDIVLSPRRENAWVYKRDEEISRPLEHAILHAGDLPYLAPELVLLFKSRSTTATGESGPRTKDRADFDRIAPRLSDEQKNWLRSAVSRREPTHPWLARL
ncbi:hypothetical protein BH24DEI2_BH24DEI2_22300 [soil metagenome]